MEPLRAQKCERAQRQQGLNLQVRRGQRSPLPLTAVGGGTGVSRYGFIAICDALMHAAFCASSLSSCITMGDRVLFATAPHACRLSGGSSPSAPPAVALRLQLAPIWQNGGRALSHMT